MKKYLLLLAVGMFLANTPLQAYQCEYNSFYGNGYQTTDCCPQECGSSGSFSVGGDWLYWKTDQTQLIYGAEVNNLDVGFVRAKTLSPKFKYHNGWRAFADYTTADKIWKFAVIYTHAPSSAKNNFDSNSMLGANFGTIFNMNFPIFSVIANNPFNNLNSSWSSNTNYLDILAARSFDVCQNILITPYIGFRGIWLDQKFRLSGSIDTEELDLSFNSKLSGRCSGLGLMGGIKGGWEIFEGFSLIGNVGGSVLYTWNRNHGDLSIITDVVDEGLNISYRNNGHSRGIPMFDAFIGFKYANTWNNFGFNFHLGWEEHIIFDTSDFSLASAGNTTMQGLTLGASIGF